MCKIEIWELQYKRCKDCQKRMKEIDSFNIIMNQKEEISDLEIRLKNTTDKIIQLELELKIALEVKDATI